MKKFLLTIAALVACAPVLAQETITYTYPGTGALYDGTSRANTKNYTNGQTCIDDAKIYLATKRGADKTTTNLTVRCESKLYITNELVSAPNPIKPVVVTPLEPVVTKSPGYGQIPPSGARINAGSGLEQIHPTSEIASRSADGTGAFRTVCEPSHYAFDDPIVFPAQPGRSHLHMFFGNTATNAFSTAESTRTTGNSTCRGGIVNRSAYWIPALINMTTGYPVNADKIDSYYKVGYLGVKGSDIKPLPQGLRMLAGDSMNRVADPYARPYSWKCHNQGDVKSATIILDCPVGDQLELEVNFAQCWDGRNLDSPDGKSHMAYANGGCPASHPVALPEISFHVLWPISTAGEARNWRLSSDTYTGSAGLSAHADWVGGWRKDVSDAFSLRCVGEGRDCKSHLSGDGRAMY